MVFVSHQEGEGVLIKLDVVVLLGVVWFDVVWIVLGIVVRLDVEERRYRHMERTQSPHQIPT